VPAADTVAVAPAAVYCALTEEDSRSVAAEMPVKRTAVFMPTKFHTAREAAREMMLISELMFAISFMIIVRSILCHSD